MKSSLKNIQNKRTLGLLGILMFILGWQILIWIKADPALVGVDKIFKSLISILSDEKFYRNLLSTLKIVFLGSLIGIGIGFTIGTIMSFSKKIHYILNPIVEMFRSVPAITLFPILLVMFGIGDFSRIFVIFWTATPSILLPTIHALESVQKDVIEAGKICGASNLRILICIKLPLAMSEILNGVRLGVGSSFIAIVVAEMLGATGGIGYMLTWSTNAFKFGETYAYIMIIAIIGALVNYIMSALVKRYERSIF